MQQGLSLDGSWSLRLSRRESVQAKEVLEVGIRSSSQVSNLVLQVVGPRGRLSGMVQLLEFLLGQSGDLWAGLKQKVGP